MRSHGKIHFAQVWLATTTAPFFVSSCVTVKLFCPFFSFSSSVLAVQNRAHEFYGSAPFVLGVNLEDKSLAAKMYSNVSDTLCAETNPKGNYCSFMGKYSSVLLSGIICDCECFSIIPTRLCSSTRVRIS